MCCASSFYGGGYYLLWSQIIPVVTISNWNGAKWALVKLYFQSLIEAILNERNAGVSGGDAGLLSRIQGLGGVDPVNQMPREPNQQPAQGQRKLLPRDRVPSSIPKGGTDGAWVYPSPQMFYNGVYLNFWEWFRRIFDTFMKYCNDYWWNEN